MDKESISRLSIGFALGLFLLVYAILLFGATGGFDLGAFIVWILLSMFTAIFFILVDIRNVLWKMNKNTEVLKDIYEKIEYFDRHNLELSMPIEFKKEEKPTQPRRKK